MAINLQSTRTAARGRVKVLVYGQAGAGKTTLIGTLPDPVVISAEGGLLSLSGLDIPFVEIRNMTDLSEAFAWLSGSDEAKGFASVAIDSISEIAEVVLTHEKRIAKDPRQAYGAMQDQMAELIRGFRDLPAHHVYMTAKLDKAQDEMGKMLYSPFMPGSKTGQALPYYFDEVLALRVERDADGTPQRMLLCDSDGSWSAKDRSGRLDRWEEPSLGAIIGKIEGAK